MFIYEVILKLSLFLNYFSNVYFWERDRIWSRLQAPRTVSTESVYKVLYDLYPTPLSLPMPFLPILPSTLISHWTPYPTQTTSGPPHLLCPLPRTLFPHKLMCLTPSRVQMLLSKASLRHPLPNTNNSLFLSTCFIVVRISYYPPVCSFVSPELKLQSREC